jgi:hypothetical protein
MTVTRLPELQYSDGPLTDIFGCRGERIRYGDVVRRFRILPPVEEQNRRKVTMRMPITLTRSLSAGTANARWIRLRLWPRS